jgi:hypothetical protein
MDGKPYNFLTQHQVGKSGEVFLDQWLQVSYQISDVSHEPKYQRSGIDRVLTKPDGTMLTVEYKVDATAKRTGNLFFETVSNDARNSPGWGWSSQADYIIFLIPEQEIIVFETARLRALIWEKRDQLCSKAIPNEGYNTIGYPLSIMEAKTVAFHHQPLRLDCF